MTTAQQPEALTHEKAVRALELIRDYIAQQPSGEARSNAMYDLNLVAHAALSTRAEADGRPQTVPAGFVLVPAEATEEMKSAAVRYVNGNAVYKNVAAAALRVEESIYGEVYAAMLAAAPAEAPANEGDYKAMFLAAVSALAEIDEVLGLPADGCNDPQVTVSALKDYVAGAREVVRGFGGALSEHVDKTRATIAEGDAISEALKWTEAALEQACNTIPSPTEDDIVQMAGESKTIGQVLDVAVAALAAPAQGDAKVLADAELLDWLEKWARDTGRVTIGTDDLPPHQLFVTSDCDATTWSLTNLRDAIRAARQSKGDAA